MLSFFLLLRVDEVPVIAQHLVDGVRAGGWKELGVNGDLNEVRQFPSIWVHRDIDGNATLSPSSLVAGIRGGNTLGIAQDIEEDRFQDAPRHYHSALPGSCREQPDVQLDVVPCDDRPKLGIGEVRELAGYATAACPSVVVQHHQQRVDCLLDLGLRVTAGSRDQGDVSPDTKEFGLGRGVEVARVQPVEFLDDLSESGRGVGDDGASSRTVHRPAHARLLICAVDNELRELPNVFDHCLNLLCAQNRHYCSVKYYG